MPSQSNLARRAAGIDPQDAMRSPTITDVARHAKVSLKTVSRVINDESGMLSVCRETGYGLQIHPCDSSSPPLASHGVRLVRGSTAPPRPRKERAQ